MQSEPRRQPRLPPVPHVDEFKYGDEVLHNVLIRLKGWSSWWQAQVDNPPKMQFVLAFDGVDTHQRFHGSRKVELDMPRIDPSYLRQRVALSYLRALGVPAECANSGRLFINGALYGLLHEPERPDQEFVTRIFPARIAATCGTAAGSSRSTRTRWGCRTRASTPSGRRRPRQRSPRSPTWTRRCSNGRPRRCSPTPTATGSATGTTSSTTTRRADGSGYRTTSTRRSTGTTRTSTRCSTGAATPAGRRRGSTTSPC